MSDTIALRDGVPHTADGRPYAMTLHQTPPGRVHPRTGLPSVVLRLHCPPLPGVLRKLARLGFFRHERSGATAAGGPGHRVRADWVMPLSRWQAQTARGALLRAELKLIMATCNPSMLPGDRTGQRAVEAASRQLEAARSAMEDS